MTSPILRASALLLAASALAAGPARGQSLLDSRGLGYPYEPVDARALALGGGGLGLPGLNMSLVSPAEIAGIPAPALSVVFQPDHYSSHAGNQATSGTVSRFPLVHVALPVGRRAAVSLGYGAFLDQHWRASVTDSVTVGGIRREVSDSLVSEGAIARLRLGVGYRATDRLWLGLGADIFSGVVRDSVTRRFTAGDLAVNRFGTDRSHSGVGFTAGIRWMPSDPIVISGAVSGGGSIKAETDATATQPSVSREYTNPLVVNLGSSARVGGNTSLLLAGRWAGWGAANDDLAASGGARDVTSVSAGVEYEGFSVQNRRVPLRLGGRVTQLPFRWGSVADNFDFPTERAISGGFGMRFGGGAAMADAAIERGWRGGGDAVLDESFWRLSFSLSLLGR